MTPMARPAAGLGRRMCGERRLILASPDQFGAGAGGVSGGGEAGAGVAGATGSAGGGAGASVTGEVASAGGASVSALAGAAADGSVVSIGAASTPSAGASAASTGGASASGDPGRGSTGVISISAPTAGGATTGSRRSYLALASEASSVGFEQPPTTSSAMPAARTILFIGASNSTGPRSRASAIDPARQRDSRSRLPRSLSAPTSGDGQSIFPGRLSPI
jgi:hypothetical protein